MRGGRPVAPADSDRGRQLEAVRSGARGLQSVQGLSGRLEALRRTALWAESGEVRGARRLSVVFGFLLMGAITGSLELYLRLRGKVIPPLTVMNVLGVTFFFPFVPLQLLDLAALLRRRWTMAVIIPLHSLVLVWEAVATMAILGRLYQLGVRDRIAGVGLIVGTWIGVARPLWR